MTEEEKAYNKALKVFRLETTVAVSVSGPGMQAQSVRTDFIPVSDQGRLQSTFQSAGLIPKQVAYALQKLERTAKNEGFLIPIDQDQPGQ